MYDTYLYTRIPFSFIDRFLLAPFGVQIICVMLCCVANRCCLRGQNPIKLFALALHTAASRQFMRPTKIVASVACIKKKTTTAAHSSNSLCNSSPHQTTTCSRPHSILYIEWFLFWFWLCKALCAIWVQPKTTLQIGRARALDGLPFVGLRYTALFRG